MALLLIATFLSSIPLVFAQNQTEYKCVINVLRNDSSFAKPDGVGGGAAKKTPADYLLLGYKWPTANPMLTVYVKDASAGTTDLISSVTSATIEWDSHTGGNLFSTIVNNPNIEVETSGTPDRDNEIIFGGRINGDSNIIAVTITWYTIRAKAIVEFDMVLNNIDYTWGNADIDQTSTGGAVMDLQNIVTHEIGHGLGLADLYPTSRNYNPETWPHQTMYGYSYNGDIEKRDLADGDIAGIQKLYGL